MPRPRLDEPDRSPPEGRTRCGCQPDQHDRRVMRVPREATEAERETLRQQLEAELRAITKD